jgi:2-dehydro-3-deoxyphosphogluconate aldolase/(4S)-4-hydroxy-2-oxoglutarate aldolase
MERLMSDYFQQVFAGQRVMAVLRGMTPERTVALAERAWDLGIDLVEVPVQVDEAFASLEAAVRAGERRGRDVGAGTVVTIRQLDRVIAAGARFAVSPGLDLAVLHAAGRAGLPFLPGVMTPSEVQAAVGAGAHYLKAFPAAVLGPTWFTNMAGPFPGVRFVATGGVNARNASTFLDAGAVAVGVGSALEDEQQIPLLAKLTTEGATHT